jgi:hypothetical protein
MAYWSNRTTHDAAWRWVFDALKPEILLCQECVPPHWVRQERNVLWSQAYPGSKQPWGTGLVTSFPCEPAPVPALDVWFKTIRSSVPGKDELAGIHQAGTWFVTGRVEIPTLGPTLVGSFHSPAYPIEKERLDGVDITAMKLKRNPDLWLTDVVFHHVRPLLGTKVLVGGDFNASRLLDKRSGAGGNNEFFDRIAKEGFVSLHRKFHEADEH